MVLYTRGLHVSQYSRASGVVALELVVGLLGGFGSEICFFPLSHGFAAMAGDYDEFETLSTLKTCQL